MTSDPNGWPDHESIWLEPHEGSDPDTGRVWCEHAAPGANDDRTWTEYVRADLVAARVAETRTKALEEAAAWHDEQAAYCAQRAQERLSDGWPEAMAVLKTTQASHLHSAAAIRALKEAPHE
jgi:hypothetical protein